MARSFLLAILVVCCIRPDSSVAMLQELPMPQVLAECYEEQRRSTNITETVAQAIQYFCVKEYLYSTLDMRFSVQMTQEQRNYIDSLAREASVIFEEGALRKKRQARRWRMPVRKECRVLSRGEWNALTGAFRALKNDRVCSISF